MPEQRETVWLEQTAECPECETYFDLTFQAPPEVWEKQDIEEPPTTKATCPNCGHEWEEQYAGWSNYGDA